MRIRAVLLVGPMASPAPTLALSPYVYGTTRLGDASIDFDERVRVARAVRDAGIWMHSSHQYGDALDVLARAFAEGLASPLVVKIGWESTDEVRRHCREIAARVGKPRIEVAQLCLNGELARDFARGGPCLDDLERIRDEGLVERYLLQVFPWTSDVALKALERGHASRLVEGYIFYLNPLQRFASNALWARLRQERAAIVSMRTVAGGNVIDLRDVPGAAWKPYLQRRAAEVAPIFERSGIESWPQFCVRFAHSVPGVVATVGATSKFDRLDELLRASERPIEPLDGDIVEEIEVLHRRWAEEEDAFGKPGEM